MYNTPNSIRVVLVDDHPIVRMGIRQLLERNADIVVVGESGEGQHAVRLIMDVRPDVVVLDISLPDISGTEVAQQILAAGYAGCILALSAYDDERHILEVLANGVAGYLTKEEALATIAEAVRGVARGETGWLSRRAMEKILRYNRQHGLSEYHQNRDTPHHQRLSARELQVLYELARGQDNQQIAQKLTIAEGTVKNHITTIYGKIGVRTRAEAVAWAWHHGLLNTAAIEEYTARRETLHSNSLQWR